jgi:exosome complex component CSL4
MSEKDKPIILPGDKISSIEEYIPGEGTFEENGNIYAGIGGLLRIDHKNRKVDIQNFKLTRHSLKNGYKVIGIVKNIIRNIAEIEITYIEDSRTETKLTAYLPIKIGKNRENFPLKIGDYIRAKVISVSNFPLLSIRDKETGIIYSECNKCGKEFYLSKDEKILICKECNNKRNASKVSLKYLLREK